MSRDTIIPTRNTVQSAVRTLTDGEWPDWLLAGGAGRTDAQVSWTEVMGGKEESFIPMNSQVPANKILIF